MSRVPYPRPFVPAAPAAGGGATLPDDPAAVLLDATAPGTLTGLDAAGVGTSYTQASARALLGLAKAAPLTGTAGWTLRAGVGGATVTGGAVRLTAPLLTPDGGWTGVPLAAYPHGITGRYPLFAIDAVARLKTFTGGDSGNVYAGFGLRVGSSAVDGFVLQARGNGGSNSLFGYAEVIGPAGTVGTASPLRATLASGQFWQRVVLFNGYVRFFYGTGSAGAEPTSWTELGSSSSLGGVTPTNTAYLECTLGLGGSGSPDAVTVEWDNVSASIVGLR